ncbi:MAG TPA: hypothetical protein VFT88_05125 [Acidobacteriaceae bacterium]|jgi:hypothetical protein|nr:hypothetical protein [Acidobacteriaceae bacterium]
MAHLTPDERNHLLARTFGLPKQRKFPMPDKSHARNALARASEGVHDHTLSLGEVAQVRAKAHQVLGQ